MRTRHPDVSPSLSRKTSGRLALWTDDALAQWGARIAFTERVGGVSGGAYSSLNLAPHVGDEPSRVDENRLLALDALELAAFRASLTAAEQVHGSLGAIVDRENSGAGAYAAAGRKPLEGVDALITSEPEIPLLLCFADCVPVILVGMGAARGVAVVHAGWRGIAAGIISESADALRRHTKAAPQSILAYIGPHIMSCHYEVGPEVLTAFGVPDTFAGVRGRFDLAREVSAELERAGVPSDNRVVLDHCTAENTDRFFSHRAEGLTGRQGAIACILRSGL